MVSRLLCFWALQNCVLANEDCSALPVLYISRVVGVVPVLQVLVALVDTLVSFAMKPS